MFDSESGSQLLQLTMISMSGMGAEFTPGYVWTGFALFSGIIIYTSTRPKDQYATIPAVGRTGIISSYIDAIRFIWDAHVVLQEGYHKYKSSVFRFPEPSRWHIVVCSQKHIEEFRKAPDDVLSPSEATNELLGVVYTMGSDFASSLHVDVVRNHVSRNLDQLFPQMWEELVPAFEEYIPITDDWTPVKPREVVMNIISRVSNRTFVGAPLCRNLEWIKLNVKFAVDLIIGAGVITSVPGFSQPFAGRWLTPVRRSIRTGVKLLGPVIEERRRHMDQYGHSNSNDSLSWIMEAAEGEERTTRNLTIRILVLNFAAIHTTSITFTNAFLNLAYYPQYIAPIREEIEAVITEHGWSRASIARLHKLDSFLKESLRMDGTDGINMHRYALKEFTFSDGTHIPQGGIASVLMSEIHLDLDIPGEKEGEARDRMVATNTKFLPFGHGRHACPGRPFAANELKAMMAHLVLTYDIKAPKNGVRPSTQWFSYSCAPDPKAEVLFKKRCS
ncbi:cytochrome P450 [Ramaria rubella]|nr:cytochrome P450 [Ramaria rubella]